jgi:hypothetical protein
MAHFSDPPPPKCGAGLSFSKFGFRTPGRTRLADWTRARQKPKAALGSETKKKKRPAVSPFEVAGEF